MPMPVDTEGVMVTNTEHITQEAIPLARKPMSAPLGGTCEGSNEGRDEESDLDNPDSDNRMTTLTVSYKFLSLGPEFPDFFGEGYFSILIRKEYNDMFLHISNLRKDGRRGVVVTGTPGIGEKLELSTTIARQA